MAHFARLDKNHNVLTVIKVADNCCLDKNGQESESVGVAFCQSLYGADTTWVQTSINNNIRKNFATIGSYYDPELDAFIPRQSFPSWSLNPETCQWEPPVPRPDTNEWVTWLENEQRWATAEELAGIGTKVLGSP